MQPENYWQKMIADLLNHISQFFSSLQPKDWITLVASIFALLFSLLTFRQKSGESRIALRKHLTDLLEKLSALNTEISKFRHLQNKKDELPPNYGALMNDQRRMLVRQADFLASKIPELVAPYEYLVIAGAFDGIDQVQLAEKYFSLAIDTKQQTEKGIAIRGYARYLFNDGRIAEARSNYEQCIACFEGDSDRAISYRADTYQRWALQEKDWADPVKEKELLEKSYAEYGRLKNPFRRQTELEKIDKLMARPAITTPPDIADLADPVNKT